MGIYIPPDSFEPDVEPVEGFDPARFEADATQFLDAIVDIRDALKSLPGVLNGELDRFRERVDRLIRESEVDNWRQVRIFLRDVDAIASDLTKAATEKRLGPKQILVLDQALRKARKRDFYGARKIWRKLDKIAGRTAELRDLEGRYRDGYREAEARMRHLRSEAEHLSRIPKPTASAAEASALIADVDAFSEAAEIAFLDFLARVRADAALPTLLDASQGGGVGVPAPPSGCDPEPLLALLADDDASRTPLRERSFYGILELPGYSDAKLTHLMGDARLVRRALDSAWPWLKAIQDEERRSLRIQWTEDPSVLKRRLVAITTFLERTGGAQDAITRGHHILESLASGRFEELQRASKLYATHGRDADRKYRGELDSTIEAMTREASLISTTLKRFPEPGKLESATTRSGAWKATPRKRARRPSTRENE
jgi:hypothetical protein